MTHTYNFIQIILRERERELFLVLFEERDFYFIKKKAQVTAMELEREGKRLRGAKKRRK